MEAPRSVWAEYGFKANPYSTDPIDPVAGYRDLLVGRDEELAKIKKQLVSEASVIALEGDFGVGKTSLALAAAYDASLWDGTEDPLFVPLNTRLSLQPDDTRGSFEQRAFGAIASTIIDNGSRLKRLGHDLDDFENVERSLRNAQGGGYSKQAGVAGLSGGYGVTRTANTSALFADRGLIDRVDGWLKQMFPTRRSGAVICFLDNLEELNDKDTAVRVMEPLRDALFKRTGLVWILSGAQGIIRTSMSSPKMTGVFLNPIQVLPLPEAVVPQVVAKRVSVLKDSPLAVAPVSERAFARVYRQIGSNLRYSLNLVEKYAIDQDPETLRLMTAEQRDVIFERELSTEAREIYDAHKKVLKPANAKVLEKLVGEKSGVCTPSDFAEFGYANMPPFIARLQELAQAHLITYTVDEEDQRRRNVTVTDHGRLAYLGQMLTELI